MKKQDYTARWTAVKKEFAGLLILTWAENMLMQVTCLVDLKAGHLRYLLVKKNKKYLFL